MIFCVHDLCNPEVHLGKVIESDLRLSFHLA
jgi:hypothetical protein